MDNIGKWVADWPVENPNVAVFKPTGIVAIAGDPNRVMRIASVSKLLVAYAGLVAWEEGSLALEDPAGPPGSTVKHLLSHASGLSFDDRRTLVVPGKRRIYSNTGIEVFAEFLAQRTELDFGRYLEEAVCQPLQLAFTELNGSAAHGVHSTVADLARFGQEILQPQLIDSSTLQVALSPHFPELCGVLPGLGSYRPNPWGLGFEIKGDKSPHWTGTLTSPATVGHFGGTGTFFWIDPAHQLGAVGLANRDFDQWAMQAWPEFSDQVIRTYGSKVR